MSGTSTKLDRPSVAAYGTVGNCLVGNADGIIFCHNNDHSVLRREPGKDFKLPQSKGFGEFLAVSEEMDLVFGCGPSGTRSWHINDGSASVSHRLKQPVSRRIAVSPWGKHLMSDCGNGIDYCRLTDGYTARIAGCDRIEAMTFACRGRRFAVASTTGAKTTVKLWSGPDGDWTQDDYVLPIKRSDIMVMAADIEANGIIMYVASGKRVYEWIPMKKDRGSDLTVTKYRNSIVQLHVHRFSNLVEANSVDFTTVTTLDDKGYLERRTTCLAKGRKTGKDPLVVLGGGAVFNGKSDAIVQQDDAKFYRRT